VATFNEHYMASPAVVAMAELEDWTEPDVRLVIFCSYVFHLFSYI